jgi:hypothetical protein
VADSFTSLSREAARRFLLDPYCEALTALVSAASFIGEDLLEDGQPVSEMDLQEMLAAENVKALDENLSKCCGLLYAISGDEFLESVPHFRRIVGAVTEGDPFVYEEDETPTVPEIFWAFYQINLLIEDDITQELGTRVTRYLERIADEEAEDQEALQTIMEEDGFEPEDLKPYAEKFLGHRMQKLALELKDLNCKPEWVADMDPELAELML